VTSGIVALSAHAIVPDPQRQQEVLERANDLMGHMGINHITVQIERRDICEGVTHVHP
jgi:Co/Zn/Cd efflux system component